MTGAAKTTGASGRPTGSRARTHDLVRFRADPYRGLLPDWVDQLGAHVWAVVRRQELQGGRVAVGLRGRLRSERQALDIDGAHIVERVTPEALATGRLARASGASAALDALTTGASAWFGSRAWGPTGSVGFELATGLPVVRETSDLDILVRAHEHLQPAKADAILEHLAGLPARVDCLLETPSGGVALAEWATSEPGSVVLLRTSAGPRLVRDPWDAAARKGEHCL